MYEKKQVAKMKALKSQKWYCWHLVSAPHDYIPIADILD